MNIVKVIIGVLAIVFDIIALSLVSASATEADQTKKNNELYSAIAFILATMICVGALVVMN